MSVSSDSVTLFTRQGVALFDGGTSSPKNGQVLIFGVPHFSVALKKIYPAAAADDPWADWWLVKIDQALDRSSNILQAIGEEISGLYPEDSAINIHETVPDDPVIREIRFSVPSYPYRAAYMIVECDKLTLNILHLYHVGLITRRQMNRLLSKVRKAARSALQSAGGYRHQGVTRSDVVANNHRAQEARDLMGEVPDEILDMSMRSDFAPVIQAYRSVAMGQG